MEMDMTLQKWWQRVRDSNATGTCFHIFIMSVISRRKVGREPFHHEDNSHRASSFGSCHPLKALFLGRVWHKGIWFWWMPCRTGFRRNGSTANRHGAGRVCPWLDEPEENCTSKSAENARQALDAAMQDFAVLIKHRKQDCVAVAEVYKDNFHVWKKISIIYWQSANNISQILVPCATNPLVLMRSHSTSTSDILVTKYM